MIKMIILSDGNVTFDYNEEGILTLTEEQKFIESVFGTMPDEEAISLVCEKYPHLTKEKILGELNKIFKLAYKEIIPGLIKKIQESNPNILIAIATDHTKYVSSYLKDFVNYYYISNEIGAAKKEIKFFEEVIKRSCLKPEEIIYVDYDEEILRTASECGIHALKIEEKDLKLEEKIEIAKEANR